MNEAKKLLKKFSYLAISLLKPELHSKPTYSLRLIASLSSSQNLGVCADNFQQCFSALTSYLKAFGYQGDLEQDKKNQSNEPVYLKFSTQKMSYYFI